MKPWIYIFIITEKLNFAKMSVTTLLHSHDEIGSTDPIVMEELYLRAGMIHRPSSLWSNTEGDIFYNHPLYDSAPPGSLSKCQVYLKLCEQRHFKCKVQCRAR